ncbi:unnamed protein product [Pieris brassicae]|uniref:Uncharacterized protein n=1 Tax=Pieris brassicae TaxID=7116 RepID=A0A9P0TZF6_PIEBR|nr:unnamed protein product [Pieris brassicae]
MNTNEKIQPFGRLITQYLQENVDGVTLTDVVQHLQDEHGEEPTEELKRSPEAHVVVQDDEDVSVGVPAAVAVVVRALAAAAAAAVVGEGAAVADFLKSYSI